MFTIGYEGLNQKQFLKHLAWYKVDVVADIRKLPTSRKKGFSKTVLNETLRAKRIDYLNFRELGAPKEIRDELYASNNLKRFLTLSLTNRFFIEFLEKIAALTFCPEDLV